MKLVLCFMLGCTALTAAIDEDSEPWSLSCQLVDYQDNQLHLTGDVVVQAIDGAEMRCDKAIIDKDVYYCIFEGAGAGSCAVVRGNAPNRSGGCGLPVYLQGQRIEVWGEGAHAVQKLSAEGAAEMGFGNEWRAKGDQALFKRHAHARPDQPFAGMIELLSKDPEGCLVQHSGGSIIRAQTMTLDTSGQLLRLTEVKGTINSAESQDSHLEMSFKANTAVWDHPRELMTLTGDVVIEQSADRRLTTQGEVRLRCHQASEGLRLQRIECDGPTDIAFGGGHDHLHCFGTCVADIPQQQLLLTSPKGADGTVAPDQQLTFNGPEGDMTADQLTLFYGLDGGQVLFNGCFAKGHVCLKRPSGNGAQYALADALHYKQQAGELLFQSKKGRRVLFFDSYYDAKVSAPSVLVKRDAVTGKETIKGLGDVRLTLLDQEFMKLRQRFTLEEKNERKQDAQ